MKRDTGTLVKKGVVFRNMNSPFQLLDFVDIKLIKLKLCKILNERKLIVKGKGEWCRAPETHRKLLLVDLDLCLKKDKRK